MLSNEYWMSKVRQIHRIKGAKNMSIFTDGND